MQQQQIEINDMQLVLIKAYVKELKDYEDYFDINDKKSNELSLKNMKQLKEDLDIISIGLNYRKVLEQMGLVDIIVPKSNIIINK